MFQKIERESFFKSFSIFFISQTVFITILSYMEYQKEIKQYEEQLFNTMRVCSFNLKCDQLSIDFVSKQMVKEPYKLYKTKKEVSSFFLIPSSSKNYLKIYISKEKYLLAISQIQHSIIMKFILELIIIALVSIGFTLYTLAPYRSALLLTQEFIKDILHDFNTPLSTLRLNVAMLKKECPNNNKLERIQNTVTTILRLENNLRNYLYENTLQKELFDLKEVIEDRVKEIDNGVSSIKFDLSLKSCEVYTHKESIIRIIDNLISNAVKYNKQNGTVWIILENNKLIIKDNGRGIQNPKKVFQRYYKEQERGIGIGLHIVKKLCNSLNLSISVISEIGNGSSFTLDLSKIIKNKKVPKVMGT